MFPQTEYQSSFVPHRPTPAGNLKATMENFIWTQPVNLELQIMENFNKMPQFHFEKANIFASVSQNHVTVGPKGGSGFTKAAERQINTSLIVSVF